MAAEARGAKSEAIRAYLSKNPNAGPTEVVKALAEKGTTVTPALVSNLKGKSASGGKKVAKKSGKKSGKARATLVTEGYNSTTNQLVDGIALVKKHGGAEKLRNLIDEVERFQAEISG